MDEVEVSVLGGTDQVHRASAMRLNAKPGLARHSGSRRVCHGWDGSIETAGSMPQGGGMSMRDEVAFKVI